MANANTTSPAGRVGDLQPGDRCRIYGQPGTIEYRCADGAYGVRLDGERRIDEWHPMQVEAVS